MKKRIDYINTRLGSKNSRRLSNGNVYPVTGLPHGMASFTVQTNSDERWFFDPYEHSFEGVRLTHQPSPWIADYGHMLFMVTDSTHHTNADTWYSSYVPKDAVFQPNYMKFWLQRYFTSLEVAPTSSGAAMRVRSRLHQYYFALFPYEGETVLEYDELAKAIKGYTTACVHETPFVLKEYFYITVDRSFAFIKTDRGYYLKLDGDAQISVATSFISVEQAELNHSRELLNKDFDSLVGVAEEEWETKLNRIDIEATDERKRVFYTCLYRSMIFPRRFYEIDNTGRKQHINISDGSIAEGVLYVDNGFWDTFRTVYPLLSILEPDLYAEMVEGFYNIFVDTGWLPRWISPTEIACMPGTLIEAVFADAIVKNIVSKELGIKLVDAMIQNAETDNPDPRFGRKAVKAYRELGYVPRTLAKESVNETLDCCYGDYCIYSAAKHLGMNEVSEKYAQYIKNYKNIFDPETGFMRGRDEQGKMKESFCDIAWGDEYTEGSAWQSSFAVYHDIQGLNELYSGKLEDKIDRLFERTPEFLIGGYAHEIHEMTEMSIGGFGQCAISNQPSFHIPYIYSELGNQAKTAYWVKRLVDEAFSDSYEGFPGDDDNGTMAAWYIFSCLGLYPFAPGRGDYTKGVMCVEKAIITLSNGTKINVSDKLANVGTRITHQELIK